MGIRTERLSIDPVTEEGPEDLLPIFNSNPAFLRASDRPAGRSAYDLGDVQRYLYEETTRADSTCLAIRLREGGTLVGTACYVAPYPGAGYPWIGLLILDAAWQGLGLGREAAEGLEAALAGQGWPEVRLSVVKVNPRARSFWERCGYAVIEETDDRDGRSAWILRKALGRDG